ncbi:high affinity glucose transporter [Sporothrix eucalyptigena]|uniref:High affinity glucose transporter n=1 Tax=Sporothrix eucalyptigena TaxID=1812306 RepID=A0ABP0B679_9PEZI
MPDDWHLKVFRDRLATAMHLVGENGGAHGSRRDIRIGRSLYRLLEAAGFVNISLQVYKVPFAGLTGNVNLIASSIQYVANVVFTLPTILILDRSGRRLALPFGSTFVMIWLFASAPISWSYPPELLPVRLGGKAVWLATSTNWAFGFAISYYILPGYEHLQWRIFLLFGSFNVVAGLQAFFFFSEAKGLSLEDADEISASGVKA